MKKDAYRLFLVTTMLVCFGLVMVYSSSSCHAYDIYRDSAFYFKRHILYLLLGAVAAFFVGSPDYTKFKKYSKLFLGIGIAGLLLVLIPGIGYQAGGARRWIRIGFLGFQPSEFASLFIIVYLADILERRQNRIRNFLTGFMPPLAITLVFVSLILLQPDLGNAAVLLAVTVIMLFVSGVNMLYFLPFVLMAIPVFAFLIFKVPYRIRRIVGFLSPWQDVRGAGFQIIQSFLALGSGGIFGQGLGCSRQKLFYLPQAHTDFIFSIIGEELGLIGTLSVVALFALFVLLGINISLNAKDLFGRFLALGITVSIGLKSAINIAVSTGAVPTKGLPLPFISYGGTALIFNLLGAAILINIANNK